MPTEPPRGVRHRVDELRAAQRRHRIAARTRPLEDVAARIDDAADVARLARYAERVLHLVVVGLELVQAERPVLDGRAARNSRGAVAASRFGHDAKVPGAQAP